MTSTDIILYPKLGNQGPMLCYIYLNSNFLINCVTRQCDFLSCGIAAVHQHGKCFYFLHIYNYNTGCIKKLNKFEIARSKRREAAQTFKFMIKIDCFGTCDVE